MTQQPGSPGWPGGPPPAGNQQPPTQGGWPPPPAPGRYPGTPAQPPAGGPAQYPGQPQPSGTYAGQSHSTGQYPGQPQPSGTYAGQSHSTGQYPGQPQPSGPYAGQPHSGPARYPGQPYGRPDSQSPGQRASGAPGQPQSNATGQYPDQAPWRPGQAPAQPWSPSQQPAAHLPTGQPDGRDPRQSFGEPPPAPVHIESFAPPKSSLSRTITFAGIAVLVLIVIGGLFFRSAQPLPSPSPSPTAVAPPSSAQPGQPFETPDGQAGGRWEIVGSHWTGEGLSVHVKITADTGPLTYGFLAFANQSAEVVEPEVGPDQPPLLRGTLRDDQSIDGWVFFATDRGDVTVILTTQGGKQMSALTVKG